MSKGLDRRLVAVIFTDMVGYTALMQIDERAAIDKRKRYAAALQANHDAGGGTIVQRLGDGSLSMFPNAIDAVRSAIGIQRELGARGWPRMSELVPQLFEERAHEGRLARVVVSGRCRSCVMKEERSEGRF